MNLLPAGKDAASHTMANLFKTENTRMKVTSQPPPSKEGTEGPHSSPKARKRSLLPKQKVEYLELFYSILSAASDPLQMAI